MYLIYYTRTSILYYKIITHIMVTFLKKLYFKYNERYIIYAYHKWCEKKRSNLKWLSNSQPLLSLFIISLVLILIIKNRFSYTPYYLLNIIIGYSSCCRCLFIFIMTLFNLFLIFCFFLFPFFFSLCLFLSFNMFTYYITTVKIFIGWKKWI